MSTSQSRVSTLIRALPTAAVHLHDPYVAEEFLQWIEPKPDYPPVCLTGLVVEARMRRMEYNYDDDCYGVTKYIDFREKVTIDDATKDIKVFCGKSYGEDHNVFSYLKWYPRTYGQAEPDSDVWLPLRGLEITPQGERVTSCFRFHEIDAILSMLAEYTSMDYYADFGGDAVPAHYFYTGSLHPRPLGINKMEWVHWLNGRYRTKYDIRGPYDLTAVEFEL